MYICGRENNKQKHTPGPWAWQNIGGFYELIAQHGSRQMVISSGYSENTGSYLCKNKNGVLMPITPDDPNAKLIRSSPDLLETLKKAGEVLKTFIEYSDNGWGLTDIHTEIEAAIKKATE